MDPPSSVTSSIGGLLGFKLDPDQAQMATRLVVSLVTLMSAGMLLQLLRGLLDFLRIERGLKSVPRAPGYNWLLGHVVPLLTCAYKGKGAWDMMEEWIKVRGPVVKFRILNTQGVALCDPTALKRIFQTGQKLYNKDLSLSYKPFLPILGSGLVTADGELWQKQRLLIGPALRTDILDDIIPIARTATERLISKLAQFKGSGQPVDLEEEFRLLTLQVIGEAVLSMAPEECDRVFPKLYLPVMEEANRRVLRPYRMYLPVLPEFWLFRSRMAQLNQFLITYFRQRWQSRQKGVTRPRTDILDRVMESIEAAGTPWSSSLETQLCYEIKTFLLAGHETSAAMLTWSVYEMSQAPAVHATVRMESDRVFATLKPEQCPPRRDVDGMTYTLAVLKEALRKYSVVPVVTRSLAVDDEIHGHKLPRGTMVACILQGTHNMYEEPTAFKPDRFMPGGEYDSFDEADRLYMFVPFIQGPRNCLGQHMALLEARVVLGMLASAFSFTAAKPGQGARHPTVIPIGPIHGMQMLLS